MSQWNVVCGYCGNPAPLVDSEEIYGRSFGFVYWCRPCDAYVGVHRDSPTYQPKGTLANAELREWRRRAHAAFDPLWQSGGMKRPEAYRHMQRLLDISPEEAHIGSFDIDRCKQLIAALGKKSQPIDLSSWFGCKEQS